MVSKVSNFQVANDSPSRVRFQESNANLLDRIQFGWLLMNAASHVILSVLLN